MYQATATPAGPVAYLALAAALAQHLAATSANPAAAGESAGRSWAVALPGTSRLGAVAAAEFSSKAGGKVARQRVATVLGQAGFGVRGNRDATELTLTTCPIVEAARKTLKWSVPSTWAWRRNCFRQADCRNRTCGFFPLPGLDSVRCTYPAASPHDRVTPRLRKLQKPKSPLLRKPAYLLRLTPAGSSVFSNCCTTSCFAY
ncbi:hypothetical protein NHF46_20490 [Arthrobacter alpinus]|nr:hypothetical protein [Arthrobacter alpinus]